MSDPQGQQPLGNIVEEPPSGRVSRVPSLPNIDAPQHEQRQGSSEPPPSSSPRTEFKRPRRGSSVSRVDVDFFDPAGVQQLRRTMTQQREGEDKLSEKRSSKSSETLQADDDQPFDFERALRRIIRK